LQKIKLCESACIGTAFCNIYADNGNKLAYSLRLYTEQFCAVLKITESFRSKADALHVAIQILLTIKLNRILFHA